MYFVIGCPLNKLQMDPFTITEVLRLHLLSAGAESSEENLRFRFQQRGAYTSLDDAGLEFRRQEPQLIRDLFKFAVYDLSPGTYTLFFFGNSLHFPITWDYLCFWYI